MSQMPRTEVRERRRPGGAAATAALSRRLAACLLAGMLAACAELPAPPPPTSSVTAAAAAAAARAERPSGAGAAVYLRRCAVCHGERGDGQSLARGALSHDPRDFTTESTRQTLTREYMIAIVRDGRPGSPMVGRGMQLSQEDIEAAVDHIRSAFIPPDPATPAGQGRALYRSLCATCHGPRGEGSSERRGTRPAPGVSLARPNSTLTPVRLSSAMADEVHVAAMGGRRLGEAERQAVVAYVELVFTETLGATPGLPAAGPGQAAGH